MAEPRSASTGATRAAGRAPVAFEVLLLALSGILFAWSLLVLVPAPTSGLWIAAIIAEEWGHFAALFCVVLVVVCVRRGGRLGLGSMLLAIAGALLFSTPAIRAAMIASTLPSRCSAAFGNAEASRVPLSALDLFRGISTAGVDVTEHVYGISVAKKLKLDLYRSRQHAGPEPLIIVIHGGSWKGGGKQQLRALNRYFAGKGFAVAAINYRHAPSWPFPAAVDDVFSAIDFLKQHAQELGIDANRVVLIGRSAGGQIALAAGYAQREPAIRGVVAFYAPSDLIFGYEQPSAPGVLDSRKVLRDYLGGTPSEKPDVYAAASPLNFVSPTTPATLLIHGGLDPIVAPAHSELLAARLEYASRPHLYLALPWATHGCDANLSGPSGQLSLYATERFLAAVMAGS